MFKFIKKIFNSKKKGYKYLTTYGWVKDVEDERDFIFKAPIFRKLPLAINLTTYCPEVYNQDNIGSCTANALGAAYQIEQIRDGKPNFIPSRLFIYYNERVLENNINKDAGATLRSGMKTLVKDGVCPETMWAYNTSKFKKKPTPNCYVEAEKHQVLTYERLNNGLHEIKSCLADGYPVVFGFMIYESFMSQEVARTGIAKMPKDNERMIGGHAVLAVGYDDEKEALLVRNSWGSAWGQKGYFYLPYGYITNSKLSADFWTLRTVE